MKGEVCIALITLSAGSFTSVARADGHGAALFDRKCASCHTIGAGDKAGPDLKGVTERRPHSWLVSWIRSSEQLIRTGDRVAIQLFRKHKQQRMPDHDLATSQIEAVIEYVAAGGAGAATTIRAASTASPQEVELGKKLFYGKVPLTHGGASCVACHGISTQRGKGSLGSDLTGVYSKYQDKGLSSLLGRDCFPRVPGLDGEISMTADERFAVKAFLRQADVENQER